MTTKDDLLAFMYVDCKKNMRKSWMKSYLRDKHINTYHFCDEDIHKFCLMLWKGVYPYEYMDG